MAGYVNGGMGVLPAGTTGNVLNSTGSDRLLLVHVSAVSANTLVAYKFGSAVVPLTTGYAMSANTPYDLGPIFFGSSEALLGGAATSSGWYVIDEMRT